MKKQFVYEERWTQFIKHCLINTEWPSLERVESCTSPLEALQSEPGEHLSAEKKWSPMHLDIRCPSGDFFWITRSMDALTYHSMSNTVSHWLTPCNTFHFVYHSLSSLHWIVFRNVSQHPELFQTVPNYSTLCNTIADRWAGNLLHLLEQCPHVHRHLVKVTKQNDKIKN